MLATHCCRRGGGASESLVGEANMFSEDLLWNDKATNLLLLHGQHARCSVHSSSTPPRTEPLSALQALIFYHSLLTLR